MLRVLTAGAIFVAAMVIVGWRSERAAPPSGSVTRTAGCPNRPCPPSHPPPAGAGGGLPGHPPERQRPLPARVERHRGPRAADVVRARQVVGATATLGQFAAVHDARSATIPWFVAGPGEFRIIGKRLDGRSRRIPRVDRRPHPQPQRPGGANPRSRLEPGLLGHRRHRGRKLRRVDLPAPLRSHA